MSNRYYQVFREPHEYTFGDFLAPVDNLGDWPIPQGDEPGLWVSNSEHPDKGLLLLTSHGLLMHCYQQFLFRAETDGEPLEICSPYKIRVRRARLLYRVENWNYVSGLRFSVACLERAYKCIEDKDATLGHYVSLGIEILRKYSESWDIYLQSKGLERTTKFIPDLLYENGWETLCDDAFDLDEELRTHEDKYFYHEKYLLEATRFCIDGAMNIDWYRWHIHVANSSRLAMAGYLSLQQEGPVNQVDLDQFERIDKLIKIKASEEEAWQSQFLIMILGEGN